MMDPGAQQADCVDPVARVQSVATPGLGVARCVRPSCRSSASVVAERHAGTKR